jgi:hypothetical protein
MMPASNMDKEVCDSFITKRVISVRICESLGLGTVVVDGFVDEDVNSLLEINDRKEFVIYLQSVDKKIELKIYTG